MEGREEKEGEYEGQGGDGLESCPGKYTALEKTWILFTAPGLGGGGAGREGKGVAPWSYFLIRIIYLFFLYYVWIYILLFVKSFHTYLIILHLSIHLVLSLSSIRKMPTNHREKSDGKIESHGRNYLSYDLPQPREEVEETLGILKKP